jgi:putative OPT family oligopeptide transporter
MLIGALLTPCNVYSGLKIGWTFNMSVAAGLIAFTFWRAAESAGLSTVWHLEENNINQTAASAAASIISAGLAAPIPALALLTGQTLTYPVLAVWLLVVSLLGIVVAAGLRNQLLLRDHLPFPAGIVTAETMSEIHKGGREAHLRLAWLGAMATAAAALKGVATRFALTPLPPTLSGTVTLPAGAPLTITAKNLGFALDPSVLMVGFGAIAGLRIGASMLAGALLAWGVLAPMILAWGWAGPGPAEAVWFGPLVEWLLWPGATLMVTASLTSFLMAIARMLARRARAESTSVRNQPAAIHAVVSPHTMATSLAAVTVLSVVAQNAIFSIGLTEALLAVALSYVLAIVAARVSGETAITPIGALGKITQLSFAAISPGNVTTNLMSANVTGGAAGQCADLMHDLRTGEIIGATPAFQLIAQTFGVLTGAFVAALVYLVLIPDPQGQLITTDWPAPAVATWKAVAEALAGGADAFPPGAVPAIVIAAVTGIAFAIAEKMLPERWQPFVPSASAIGLGFVIPAWNAISLFAGAVAATLFTRIAPEVAARYTVVIAAGLIVGESLTGVVGALATLFW